MCGTGGPRLADGCSWQGGRWHHALRPGLGQAQRQGALAAGGTEHFEKHTEGHFENQLPAVCEGERRRNWIGQPVSHQLHIIPSCEPGCLALLLSQACPCLLGLMHRWSISEGSPLPRVLLLTKLPSAMPQVDTAGKSVVRLCGPVSRGVLAAATADGYFSLLDPRAGGRLGGEGAAAPLLAHPGGFAALDGRGNFVATAGYATRMGRLVLETHVKVRGWALPAGFVGNGVWWVAGCGCVL